jgi:hypothetical protein
MSNGKRMIGFGILATLFGMLCAACAQGGGEVTVEARAAAISTADTTRAFGDAVPSGIESVRVTISEVVAHFVPAGGNGRGRGNGGGASWTTLSAGEVTLDLMTLKDNPEVLGYGALGGGKITQIRLVVSETTPPVATIDGVDYELTVPSGTIKLVSAFCVSADSDTTITLDFDAAESVTLTDAGYELRPTIKVNGPEGGCGDDDDDEADDDDEGDCADDETDDDTDDADDDATVR